MIRRLRILLLPGLAAAVSLFAGLVPAALGHGRIEPADWLIPGFLALALMLVLLKNLSPSRNREARSRPPFIQNPALVLICWALVVLPPALVCWLAASVMPWPGVLLLAAALALAAFWLGRAGARPWSAALIGLAVVVAVRFAAAALGAGPPVADVPRVAVMSPLPLFQQRARGDVLSGAAVRAPVVRALGPGMTPLDRLAPASLAAFDRLLLVQPRLLSPAELVALDAWVRGGGRVAILADPFLHWPDELPLTDPRRPPLTSLLDPLLTHWGLTLEPARLDPARPVERHILSGGALLQLAGASRFTLMPGSSCRVAENGLIAYCPIGKGTAMLIADADWMDDRLWTADPAHPRARHAWTSDALPMLTQMIAGGEASPRPAHSWLVSQDALVSALRWALGLIVLLAAALTRFAPIPMSTHVPPGPDHPPDRESDGPVPDSG